MIHTYNLQVQNYYNPSQMILMWVLRPSHDIVKIVLFKKCLTGTDACPNSGYLTLE